MRQSIPGPNAPGLVESLYNLARVYASDGRTAEAREALAQALRICGTNLPPDDAKALQIRQLDQELAAAGGQAANP